MIKIPDKVYLHLGGGLGDHYKRYFYDPGWGCLPDLKAKCPNVKTKAYAISHAPGAWELIKYHPYIDELEVINKHPREITQGVGWYGLGDGIWSQLKPIMTQQFKITTPNIYLNKEDIDFIDKIKAENKKYIVIHPFSGDKIGWKTRSPIKPEQYKPIIKDLIKEGFSILLFGESYSKRRANGSGKTISSEEKIETFDYESQGFINLIGKVNPRTGAALVRDSIGFIGTASSFLCAAWMLRKRSVTIISTTWKETLKKGKIVGKRSQEPQNKIIYIPQYRTPDVWKNLVSESTSWFK